MESIDWRRTRKRYRTSIEIQHTHFEGQIASGQGPSGRGDSDNAENEAAAAAYAAAEQLDRAKPTRGGEEVRAAEEAEEERHGSVRDLLIVRGVDMDEAEAEGSLGWRQGGEAQGCYGEALPHTIGSTTHSVMLCFHFRTHIPHTRNAFEEPKRQWQRRWTSSIWTRA